jgi:thiol-disulfide isomerase/thioredoxin
VFGGAAVFFGIFYLIDHKLSGGKKDDRRERAQRTMDAQRAARVDPSNRPGSAALQPPEGLDARSRYHGVDAAADAALTTPATPKKASVASNAAKTAPIDAKPASVAATAATSAAAAVKPAESAPAPPAPAVAPAASTVAPPPPSLPAEPHVHHSTPQAALDDIDEDALDEAEAARLRAEALTPRSAPVSEHPGRPHVSSLVAVEIPSRVYRRDADILLHVYEHWCGSCRMMAPVVDGIAATLHQTEQQQESSAAAPVRHLQVMSMDSEANVLPGFLTAEETQALPLLKFYPRCGSRRFPADVRNQAPCQPSSYSGRGNVESMLNWLHARVSEQDDVLAKASASGSTEAACGVPFDLSRAHEVARASEPATVERLKDAQQARWDSESADHPAMRLHEMAPCGPIMSRAVHAHMLQAYRSYLDDTAQNNVAELFAEYRACAAKQQKQISRFWAEVKHIADGEVEVERTRLEEEQKLKQQQTDQSADGAGAAQ